MDIMDKELNHLDLQTSQVEISYIPQRSDPPKYDTQFDSKYIYSDYIGEGSFGDVLKYLNKSTNEECAVKVVDKTKKDRYVNSTNEINILKQINHPFIINFVESYNTEDFLLIITSYISGLDLHDYLVAKRKLEESNTKFIMNRLLTALEYLHKIPIIHKDVCKTNVFLHLQNNDEIVDVKLGGFGTAETKDMPNDYKITTVFYVAPEIRYSSILPYNHQVDIFSAGALLFVIVLYTMNHDVYIVQNMFPWLSKKLPDQAKDLFSLMTCSADKRITATDALKHPWFLT